MYRWWYRYSDRAKLCGRNSGNLEDSKTASHLSAEGVLKTCAWGMNNERGSRSWQPWVFIQVSYTRGTHNRLPRCSRREIIRERGNLRYGWSLIPAQRRGCCNFTTNSRALVGMSRCVSVAPSFDIIVRPSIMTAPSGGIRKSLATVY